MKCVPGLTTCPRCKEVRDREIAAAREAALANYGKVSAEEYEALAAAARNMPPRDALDFREEGGICIDGNVLYVSYSGRCMSCGFTHEFKHHETVYKP